jgi:molybdopterin-containing oxidoreductase family membrane subunit
MELTKRGAAFYIWTVVLMALIVVGAYAWYMQLSMGLIVTGMSDTVMWGLYIAQYSFFAGLSAGALIFSAIVSIMNIEKYKQISRIAVVVAIICGFLAGAFIIADLGRPERAAIEMIVSPNPTSLLFYDLLLPSLYLLVSIFYGWAIIKGKDEGLKIKVLAAIAIIMAVLALGCSSWVFGVVKARPLWFSALLAPLFISSSIVSGIALVILTAILTSKFTKMKVNSLLLSDLGKILAVLVPIELFLLFSELVTVGYAEIPSHIDFVSLLLTGSFSPLFWFEVVVGALLPIFILAYPRTRKSTVMLTVASILVMIGAFMLKYNLIVPGLSIETLGTLGETPIGEIRGTYSPTWIEWAIVTGLYALGTFLFTISTRLFPLGIPAETKAGGE